jgi:hypothetical protein
MSRKHVFAVATLIAVAAVAGLSAVGRTVQIGTSTRKANDALVASKAQQLNRFERSLHRQLAAIPAVPADTAGTPASPAQGVMYVRPAPVVVHTHRAGGEHDEADDDESEPGDG